MSSKIPVGHARTPSRGGVVGGRTSSNNGAGARSAPQSVVAMTGSRVGGRTLSANRRGASPAQPVPAAARKRVVVVRRDMGSDGVNDYSDVTDSGADLASGVVTSSATGDELSADVYTDPSATTTVDYPVADPLAAVADPSSIAVDMTGGAGDNLDDSGADISASPAAPATVPAPAAADDLVSVPTQPVKLMQTKHYSIVTEAKKVFGAADVLCTDWGSVVIYLLGRVRTELRDLKDSSEQHSLAGDMVRLLIGQMFPSGIPAAASILVNQDFINSIMNLLSAIEKKKLKINGKVTGCGSCC